MNVARDMKGFRHEDVNRAFPITTKMWTHDSG